MELGYVVRFSSHSRPFLVKDTYCNNPDCKCNEVFLGFTEVSETERPLTNPLSFGARVNLDTWQETHQSPQRVPEVAAWIHEFLRECPPTRKAEFKASYEEGRRIARRRAEYTLDADEVLDGALVSYANILTETSALSAGGNAYTFDVRYQGREYLVEDRYCPNPRCDCESVHLEFFEAVSQPDGKLCIYQRFVGKVTFAGRLTVEERMKCRSAEAKGVLSAWWKECRDDLKVLKDRYQEVKEIGQRSLEARSSHRFATRQMPTNSIQEDVLPDDQPTANMKVGRNAPCPCGSGKKYKKCCWRKVALPL